MCSWELGCQESRSHRSREGGPARSPPGTCGGSAAFVSDFWPPEPWEDRRGVCQPLSSCCFVLTALQDQYPVSNLGEAFLCPLHTWRPQAGPVSFSAEQPSWAPEGSRGPRWWREAHAHQACDSVRRGGAGGWAARGPGRGPKKAARAGRVLLGARPARWGLARTVPLLTSFTYPSPSCSPGATGLGQGPAFSEAEGGGTGRGPRRPGRARVRTVFLGVRSRSAAAQPQPRHSCLASHATRCLKPPSEPVGIRSPLTAPT